jgi:hypothetical protein
MHTSTRVRLPAGISKSSGSEKCAGISRSDQLLFFLRSDQLLFFLEPSSEPSSEPGPSSEPSSEPSSDPPADLMAASNGLNLPDPRPMEVDRDGLVQKLEQRKAANLPLVATQAIITGGVSLHWPLKQGLKVQWVSTIGLKTT